MVKPKVSKLSLGVSGQCHLHNTRKLSVGLKSHPCLAEQWHCTKVSDFWNGTDCLQSYAITAVVICHPQSNNEDTILFTQLQLNRNFGFLKSWCHLCFEKLYGFFCSYMFSSYHCQISWNRM